MHLEMAGEAYLMLHGGNAAAAEFQNELPAVRSLAALGSPVSSLRRRCDSVPYRRSCGIDWHTWVYMRIDLER
jgi:hypothetical protein